MKKILVLTILSVVMQQSKACDICGCGVGNYNPFLFPHLAKSYVSLSYVHRVYHTFSDDGSASRESYNSLLLTGQYSINKKIKIMAMVPYQSNKLSNINGFKKLEGPGDVNLLANYKLLDKMTNRKPM